MREEKDKRSSQKSSFKRFFKKRWVFPAIYIASAAIILTAVLWYQSSSSSSNKYSYKPTNQAGQKFNEPSVEVSKSMENFKMPVANPASAVIKMGFYDFNAKASDQESALVFYNNTYQPNTGIDISAKDGQSFDVTASMSGKVTRVDEDSVLGNVIEIEHSKGVVTQYQSVKDIQVKVGDSVKQGEVIAKAGQSQFNEKAGTHVHFEIRKNGVALNPSTYFDKSISALPEEKAAEKVQVPQTNQGQQDNTPSSNGSQGASTDTPSTDGTQTPSTDGSKAPADNGSSTDGSSSGDNSSNTTQDQNS